MNILNKMKKLLLGNTTSKPSSEDQKSEIHSEDQLTNGNRILGTDPILKKSKIHFNGKNNILFCEEGVTLFDSSIIFNGDNSIVYLGKNQYQYKLDVSLHSDCVFHMGRDNYINKKMTICLSEQKHYFVGNGGLFSFGIFARVADAHLVYQIQSMERINPSKSIYIGDHVWIGQSVMLLKGTQIDSGSIIGAMSVVSGKKIPHNTSWAGNPCHQLGSNLFWDDSCVHTWKEDNTKISQFYPEFLEATNKSIKPDTWIYEYDKDTSISYDYLENKFSEQISSDEKCQFLCQLNEHHQEKNRFVHNI